MSATEQDVAATIAEYERLAIGTGQWRGTVVEFSNDGNVWAAYLFPTEAEPHPALARATVHREGVTVPTVVTVAWAETVPAVAEWAELWSRKPHSLFGAAAARAALRRAFRDAIGDRREPEEIDAAAAPAAAASIASDWLGELAEANTAEAVAALWARARKARAVTVQLERSFTARRHAIAEQATAQQPEAIAEPQPKAKPSPATVAAARRKPGAASGSAE
ncbi:MULTISPECIES: hypothetical protein [unclassified Cryobacterium]|uniref:hypothetical protein n=1 Tax=unclassified Cryobacterium TaxID=2649013 RepID=UPI002AB57165|nr:MULTISPECIES: hypothetical protein [unclassified Cryobacterium]MDY7528475.1 hypothetical protein [Cryobacterium sp. 10C2]MDY7555780.1 hypothetical protein [Cryobacterium sp. 10C3]MEB0289195.1 hypothetical protein [Cryobacterium sp. 10C2]